jgi:uncharacterized coiled-coil protein SlyX
MDQTAALVAAILGSNAAIALVKGVFQAVKERRGDGVADRRRLEARIDDLQTSLVSRDARIAHLESANAAQSAELADLQSQIGVLTRLVDRLSMPRTTP